MSAARQRTDRDSLTGAGNRPQLSNFQHCLGEIFSASATPRTVNNSLTSHPFKIRPHNCDLSKSGANNQHFDVLADTLIVETAFPSGQNAAF